MVVLVVVFSSLSVVVEVFRPTRRLAVLVFFGGHGGGSDRAVIIGVGWRGVRFLRAAVVKPEIAFGPVAAGDAHMATVFAVRFVGVVAVRRAPGRT